MGHWIWEPEVMSYFHLTLQERNFLVLCRMLVELHQLEYYYAEQWEHRAGQLPRYIQLRHAPDANRSAIIDLINQSKVIDFYLFEEGYDPIETRYYTALTMFPVERPLLPQLSISGDN